MSILSLLWKNIKWRVHNPITIILTILQPILWLVLYSAVAKQNMQDTGIENYTGFILPGLIVLVIFSTCSSTGIMNYMMKSDGSFYRILITPIRRASIILGQVLEAILCSLFEIGVMVIISRLMFSVRITSNIKSIILIFIFISSTAFFVACIAYAISLVLPNELIYETLMNAITLPIFFLSSALFPTEKISGTLKIIINLNPFTHIINSLRSIMLTEELIGKEVFLSLGLLFCLSFLSFIFSTRKLNKEMNL